MVTECTPPPTAVLKLKCYRFLLPAQAKLAQQVQQLHATLSFQKNNSDSGKTEATLEVYERAYCEVEFIKRP